LSTWEWNRGYVINILINFNTNLLTNLCLHFGKLCLDKVQSVQRRFHGLIHVRLRLLLCIVEMGGNVLLLRPLVSGIAGLQSKVVRPESWLVEADVLQKYARFRSLKIIK
jgi:hypothetical protein